MRERPERKTKRAHRARGRAAAEERQDEGISRQEAALESASSRREARAEAGGAPRVRSKERNAGVLVELFL